MTRRVLVTGARGQLGTALAATASADWEILALDRDGLDIADRGRVLEIVSQTRPELILNAAAYTAVDQAEREPERALSVNRDGPAHLAEAAAKHSARLIHVSTDYVFDGCAARPYRPNDATNPLSVYGASKLAGERVVAERLAGAVIVRSSWIYARQGRNFLNTMLKLLCERTEVRVVADQRGTPTHAASLARCLWAIAVRPQLAGIFHWTDGGETTWHGFAEAIRAHLEARGEKAATVVAIPTSEYPTPARRPGYSVLDTTALVSELGPPLHWTAELRQCVALPGAAAGGTT